jgi:hypothetical protein
MSATDLKLGIIRTDGGTQMREVISKDVFLEYRDLWKARADFPPLDVFYDGTTYWLADGFHRFYGAREAGLKTVPCTVHNGSQREAILFAVGANQANGQRRTNADKRRAVETLLNDEEWVKWSDREIAEKAGVSHQTVNNIRGELSKVDSCASARTANEPRKGKDGKLRKPPARKPVPQKQEGEPSPEPILFPTTIQQFDSGEREHEPKVPACQPASDLELQVKSHPEKTVVLRWLFDSCTTAQRALVTQLWADWWQETE